LVRFKKKWFDFSLKIWTCVDVWIWNSKSELLCLMIHGKDDVGI